VTQQSEIWRGNRSVPGQFRLRTLIEVTTICCIVVALLPLHALLWVALSSALVAFWSLRVRHWQIQFSLVMMFGGMFGMSIGLYCVVEGFRLIPEVLRENCLPDVLISVGPFCGIMGGFCAAFGLVHLFLTPYMPRSND